MIKAPSEIKAPIFAEYFATIFKGKIVIFTSGYPPHELTEYQIQLTEQEFWILKRLWNWNPYMRDLDEAINTIKAIQEKVNTHQSLKINK